MAPPVRSQAPAASACEPPTELAQADVNAENFAPRRARVRRMARRLHAIARRESEVHPIRAVTARGRRPRRNFRQAVELNSGLIALRRRQCMASFISLV